MCLTYGERGESAKAWREGKSLEEIKAIRREEAEAAAAALGAEIEFLDAGDYPLRRLAELVDRLVHVYRDVQPDGRADPSARPTRTTATTPPPPGWRCEARVLAQAIGVLRAEGEIIGAPPVFFFEPHQPEQCDFKPERAARHHRRVPAEAQGDGVPCRAEAHVGLLHRPRRRRGVQVKRNAGPNLGFRTDTMGEAYMRYYPQVTEVLA